MLTYEGVVSKVEISDKSIHLGNPELERHHADP